MTSYTEGQGQAHLVLAQRRGDNISLDDSSSPGFSTHIFNSNSSQIPMFWTMSNQKFKWSQVSNSKNFLEEDNPFKNQFSSVPQRIPQMKFQRNIINVKGNMKNRWKPVDNKIWQKKDFFLRYTGKKKEAYQSLWNCSLVLKFKK